MLNFEAMADEELLSLFASTKDETYFNELHRRYLGQLTAYVLRIHSAIGFAGAEDVVQQTFISVSQNHDQFDPKLKFGNWIFSIAANFAVNMRVALSRRPALSIEDLLKSDPKGRALVPSQLEDSREHSPEYDVFAAERNERLRLLLDELPEQHRIVMERLFFQNMTCEEAAADLNMPLGTVKTRLRWSLSRLREATAEDQELYRAA